MTSKNWTAAGGIGGVTTTTGASYPSLNDIFGSNVNGVENFGVLGDSTDQGNHDANPAPGVGWGDADCAEGWVARGFNAAGVSFVRAAVSGSAATPEVLYPSVIRLQKMKYVSRAVHGMGHNMRGLSWDGAAGTGFRETLRNWILKYRAAMWGGDGKVVGSSLFPSATGTFTTLQGQTVNASVLDPNSSTYKYRQYLLAGNFNHALGDPDMALDTYAWIYLDGAANGADMTGVTAEGGAWPPHANWVANGAFGSTLEGGHPQGLYHASCGARHAAAMPAIKAM